MPHLTIGLQTIAYEIRRSARAKRLRLTVGPGGVEVVIPERARDAEVRVFIDSHRGWIRSKVEKYQTSMARYQGPAQLVDGARIPFRGEPTPLVVTLAERVYPRVVEGDGFRVELPRDLPAGDQETATELALTRYLKRQAREDAWLSIERYGPPNQLVPSALRIKDQKRLWGSCTAANVISLNWRLILAPVDVFDYVVVHELCHIRHRHHQPPFWRAVAKVMPDFERHRHWLKQNGHLLTLKRTSNFEA
ncbi:MAG: M48 family metallopeptidase [Geminicoccaceae bacterium]